MLIYYYLFRIYSLIGCWHIIIISSDLPPSASSSPGSNFLCRGLRNNSTLKQLHISYCGITYEGGQAISDLLENARSGLELLNLTGNRLGGVGLQSVCQGLMPNTVLQKIMLADNIIDQGEEDLKGLTLFRECLLNPTSALTSVDLMWNRIGEAGATLLVPALATNKKITEFLVDLTLPMPLFEEIFRKDSGKGKKGKKGKKK